FQAEDGIRDRNVTGVQTCALPICLLVSILSRSVVGAAGFHRQRVVATPPAPRSGIQPGVSITCVFQGEQGVAGGHPGPAGGGRGGRGVGTECGERGPEGPRGRQKAVLVEVVLPCGAACPRYVTGASIHGGRFLPGVTAVRTRVQEQMVRITGLGPYGFGVGDPALGPGQRGAVHGLGDDRALLQLTTPGLDPTIEDRGGATERT